MSADTRTRRIDAAESVLRTSTYDEMSVRAVCAAADANPAAVHYHFGSKEALVSALLQNRFEPTWAARLDELAENSPTVADIVREILDPLVELQADPTMAPLVRVLAEFVLAHPQTEGTARWFRLDAWVALLTAAVRGLDAQTASLRYRFAFTVLMTEFTSPNPVSPTEVAALRDFLVAGLTGPTGR